MLADSRRAMNPFSSPVPASFFQPSLWRALGVSILLHAAVLVAGSRLVSSLPVVPRLSDALRVKLVEPVPVPAPVTAVPLQPELLRREDTPRKAAAAPERPRLNPPELRLSRP